MFTLSTEADLVAAFRPKDRVGLEVAPELTFPLTVNDYVSWMHPAGGRVFLVFAVPGGVPTGVAFESSRGDPGVVQMCDWCHCSTGSEVGLLTATLNGRKRVGVHLCSDLTCKQKLEEQANRIGARLQPALDALVLRMGRFASEGLQIDLTGANR